MNKNFNKYEKIICFSTNTKFAICHKFPDEYTDLNKTKSFFFIYILRVWWEEIIIRVGWVIRNWLQRLKILKSFASPYVRPSVRPSVCPSVCPSFPLHVCLSVRPSLCKSVCLAVRPSVLLSVCQSVCQQSLSLSVDLMIYLSVSCISVHSIVRVVIQSFFYLLLKRTAAHETDVLYSPKYTRDKIDTSNMCFGICSHLFCFALSLSVLIIMF